MNIEKRYWKWDESLNSTEYKLRANINDLLAKGLVSKCEEEQDKFTGINNLPWKIRVDDGLITSIVYRVKFFPLLDMNIWELDLGDFEMTLSKALQPTTEEDECDKLMVIFREFFVAVAGVIAYQKRNNIKYD